MCSSDVTDAQVVSSDASANLLSTDIVVVVLQEKLVSSEQVLQDSRAHEEALADELKSVSAARTAYARDVELWTERLVDVDERVDA